MMEKIKNFYGSHPIRWTLLTIVVVVAVVMLIWYAPAFTMKASEIPVKEIPVSAEGETIPVQVIVSGNNMTRKADPVVVAERAGRTLTLDPSEMILTLTDENGTTWSSAMPGATEDADKALMMIRFVGENNAFTTVPVNSYTNGTRLYNTVTTTNPETGEETKEYVNYENITLIENGVRIEMRILDNTKKLLAYMPRTLSKESYDFFISRCEELNAAGIETPYRTQLERYYRADPSDPTMYPFYTSGEGSNPDADRMIIALAEQVGYTRDMLLADCAKYGQTALSPELYDFSLTLEVTLNEKGELIARVPTNEIVTHNDYFRLERVFVLPNLCAEGASKESQGYYLVPDGAGALLKFNSSNGTISELQRPFMNNDYHQDYFWQSEYSEELMMPIFGVMYGGADSTHGMMAIIEDGEEAANLHVTLAQPTTGKNKAYVSIDTMESSWVRIYGAYADNTASYLADSGHMITDFTVRYIPYAEHVTYFDMAMDYRDYLAEAAGKEITVSEGPGLYVEMLGAITMTKRFMGVPYDSVQSMTTYANALEIIEALKGTGAAVQYDGAFNSGVLSSLNNGANLVGANGSVKEFQALKDAAAANGNDLFLQLNLSRVYDNGRNYIPYLHAARDFSNGPMTVYLYRADTAQMNGRWDPIREYTIVSPRYFNHLATAFKASQNRSSVLQGTNLAIGDLAHDVYADYRYNDIIDLFEARTLALNALETLAQDSNLALNDPFSDVAAMGDYAVNISRESSDYASYYATVPFRQLALNGLTTVVSTDVNLSSRSLDYYLLQAAELGTTLKYTVSWEDSDKLKNSHFEAMYAIHWADWQSEILNEAAVELAGLRSLIGGKAITDHTMLQPKVFQTTYGDGEVVIVTNYSSLPYTTEQGTIVNPGQYIQLTLEQEGGAL